MASAVARAYIGGLGLSPQRGPRAQPLVRGSGGQSPVRGQSPLKLKAFWQSCEEFPLIYFVFFLNIFLLTRCTWFVTYMHYSFSPEAETAVSFNFLKDKSWYAVANLLFVFCCLLPTKVLV